MSAIKAELMKLRRPLVLWGLVAFVALTAAMATISQRSASWQYETASESVELAGTQPCEAFALPEGPDCELAREQDRADARAFLEETVRETRLAGASQHPAGAGAFAADMAASALGALILLLIGAGHIGGEWSYRTIKSVLVVDPRRIRFAISKWLSLWLIGIVALAIAWGGLSALGFFQQRIYELPASAGDGVAWSDAASHVMRAALVLGIYAALATLAGILTKNMLGAFFVSFGIIIASQIAAAFPAMKSWTLGHWVGAFMPFTPHKLYYSYIWYPDFPGGASGEMQTAVWGLVTLFVLCATVSLLRITHSDIE